MEYPPILCVSQSSARISCRPFVSPRRSAVPNGITVESGVWWNPSAVEPELAVSEEAQRDFHLKVGRPSAFHDGGQDGRSPAGGYFQARQECPGPLRSGFSAGCLKGNARCLLRRRARRSGASFREVEETIFEKFPTVTVMNLAEVLTRIQEAVDQVAVVIRFLALFAIVAGVIILSSSIAGTRYRRVREVAILKGARWNAAAHCRRSFSVEFSLLGAVSGLYWRHSGQPLYPHHQPTNSSTRILTSIGNRWRCPCWAPS